MKPQLLDLRHTCRDSSKMLSTVNVWDNHEYAWHPWLRLGSIEMRKMSDPHDGVWELGSYLENCTDFEHASAHVLRIRLVGPCLSG